MGDFVNRTTKQLVTSGNNPDYPSLSWILLAPRTNPVDPYSSPDLSAVVGQPNKYWKITGDVISLMDAGEQAAVDAAALNARYLNNRTEATNTTEVSSEGVKLRALIELFNKRDNYLVNRIVELQAAMDAMKASSGQVQNLRDAIPATWLATNTRPKAAAIQDYIDDINAGAQDT